MNKDKFPLFDKNAGVLMLFTGCLAIILAGTIIFGIVEFLFQILWNHVVVGIFWSAGPVLTYWQSVLTVFLIFLIGNILGIGSSKNSD